MSNRLNPLLVVLSLVLATTASRSAVQPARPNFLWLIAEDTGPSAYSCYGEQPEAATPNIDALARDGVRFTRFYTTAPVCSTSRSAFNTGMYQTTIGAHQHRTPKLLPLPDGVRTLGGWFQQAGYYTANVRRFPADVDVQGTGKTDWNFVPGTGKTDWNFKAGSATAFQTDDWSGLKSRQPFYAQVNFQETHRAFRGEGLADPQKVVLPPYYPDHPVIRKDYADYLDSARRLDGKIGRILQQLEKDGLADNTVVLFMGDNGEAHIRGKQFCYEEGLRVPLIVRWPKRLPPPAHYRTGSVDDRLLEAIDIAPTLLSLAGAAVPSKMQGRPFLGPAAGAPKAYVYGARDRCDMTAMRIRTVRDERFRYIRTFTPEVPFFAYNRYKETSYPAWTLVQELHKQGRLTPEQAFLCQPRQPEEQLYDLKSDPHEVRNLVASKVPEHQAALRRLRTELEDWIVRTDDKGRFPEAMSAEEADAASRALRQKAKGKKR